MSKRERDLKRKLQEEQEAAAYVYQDFINTFHNPSSVNKTFLRSGTLYAEKEETDNVKKIYNPKPIIKQQKIDTNSTAIECAKILQEPLLDKPKKNEKPMSNLDLLKEELKQRHSERGEKEKLKEDYDWEASLNYYSEGADLNTTNLFVANLRSSVTENHLMLEFGAYGPLASVKIMWPRAGDEKTRMSNCGFVAFMSRKDAERALKDNQHRDDIRLGWGKPVDIPTHPIYIPGELLKYYLPPAQTDLPFGAQRPAQNISDEHEIADFLAECSIRVTIPLNKRVLALVHRVVEFVIKEGPIFEAFIMNRELKNPDFNFLFDCKSPVHVYYRWKLFSILNGDGQKSWSYKKFRMFTGGSVWLPPTPINFTEGMPEEVINRMRTSQQNTLSDFQSSRLVNLLRNLTPHRKKVSEAMLFCLNHQNAINDSIEIILESMMDPQTDTIKKIARLYLLSDILHNCKSKRLQTCLDKDQTSLIGAFKIFHQSYQELKTVVDKNNFKSRITRVLKHWDTYKLLPVDFFGEVDDSFLSAKTDALEDDNSSLDEPLDGAKLRKMSLEKNVGPEVVTIEELDMSGVKRRESGSRLEYFVPSKWDTVDPEEIEAQAMSTEKMYFMELEKKAKAGEKKTRKKRRSR